MADYGNFTAKIVDWIRGQVINAGLQGTVIGLSGGIDSAVTAVLCKKAFPETTFGVIMPCYSNPQDEEDARLVAETFDIPYRVVHLEKVYDSLLDATDEGQDLPDRSLIKANIKPRLRMTTLYYFAGLKKALVVGTDNRSELKVGYFTKYGDGGVDITPLATLVKSQVRELAAYLQIPERIISKAPTAGLWANQTDEQEMGITYEELDRYILSGQAEPEVKEIIEKLHKRSQHKLRMPAMPDFTVE